MYSTMRTDRRKHCSTTAAVATALALAGVCCYAYTSYDSTLSTPAIFASRGAVGVRTPSFGRPSLSGMDLHKLDIPASDRPMCPVGAPMRKPTAVYAAAKAGERTVTVDKPLGIKLGQTSNGLVVKSATGNAAKAGIKAGDTVIYSSSFFGDELWPSDKLSFTNSAIKAAPSPVCFVITNDPSSVDVKRLNSRPHPVRFGKKLSANQKELATHLCLDCGYIYCDPVPFADADSDYVCPQCASGKKRFAQFDAATGKITEPISLFTIINYLIVVLGLAAVGFLGYYGLKLS